MRGYFPPDVRNHPPGEPPPDFSGPPSPMARVLAGSAAVATALVKVTCVAGGGVFLLSLLVHPAMGASRSTRLRLREREAEAARAVEAARASRTDARPVEEPPHAR